MHPRERNSHHRPFLVQIAFACLCAAGHGRTGGVDGVGGQALLVCHWAWCLCGGFLSLAVVAVVVLAGQHGNLACLRPAAKPYGPLVGLTLPRSLHKRAGCGCNGRARVVWMLRVSCTPQSLSSAVETQQ